VGCGFFFFFNDTATTEIYTLSLHDALPISDDFIAMAERESGRSLDAFFNVWLYQPGKPASW